MRTPPRCPSAKIVVPSCTSEPSVRAGPLLCVYLTCATASTLPLASAASATAFAASASVPTSTFCATTS